MNDLRHLDEAACMSLLGDVPVGRFAWADDDGRVTVLPVNHLADGASIVFGTAEGGELEAVRAGRPLTFEADDLEPALSPHPWPHSPKVYLVRLVPRHVTGRRIPLRPGGARWVDVG
ncbi:pyridoxamine 5'-phosphate oxidase family protein [Actinomadura sediminis]|uniref:Pyridoxamine 5'-phosphate oxidase family protein n=1 Tax=Actinomadura sediminis TaxID=1038904 RepID=A0ABW3EFX7_9ACTN